MRDILDLHQAVRDAGLDITGLSDPGPNVRITGWSSQPTPQDIASADAIIKAFDWSDPPPVDVEARVSRLTPHQKQKLLDLAVLQAVQQNPSLLEQV